MFYIFDKDGTLVRHKDGFHNFFPRTPQDQILLPNVKETIQTFKRDGHKIGIASNQGGVAMGHITYDQAYEMVSHAAQLVEADCFLFCPHHPQGKNEYAMECDCRKPNPGMLFTLMEDYHYPPYETIFVGDMDTDEEAAKRAGVEFYWAKEVFDW